MADAMVLTARPTVYNGIPMRSRLEARTAAYLDRYGFDWTYEPRAYASRSGQYVPDFQLHRLSFPTFLEVKGPHPSVDEFMAILAKMEVIRESEPSARLMVVSDVMLSGGRFAAHDHRYGWVAAYLLQCPDHPRRHALRYMDADESVRLWCWECDPSGEVRVSYVDAMEYARGASWRDS